MKKAKNDTIKNKESLHLLHAESGLSIYLSDLAEKEP
jgi:hypothetical protein